MPAKRASAKEATARIGERVSSARTARNMRVSELARDAGVSTSLISQIERGNSRPSVATLFALAQALDVPVDSFFADPADDAACNGPNDNGSRLEPGAPPTAPTADAAS